MSGEANQPPDSGDREILPGESPTTIEIPFDPNRDYSFDLEDGGRIFTCFSSIHTLYHIAVKAVILGLLSGIPTIVYPRWAGFLLFCVNVWSQETLGLMLHVKSIYRRLGAQTYPIKWRLIKDVAWFPIPLATIILAPLNYFRPINNIWISILIVEIVLISQHIFLEWQFRNPQVVVGGILTSKGSGSIKTLFPRNFPHPEFQAAIKKLEECGYRL